MRALISVSDKTGIVEFARSLDSQGVELLSTGGTAAMLKRNGLDVIDVARYTGFPEIMSGRVKTLHPRIHAALLARPGVDDPVLTEFDIERIDLLVVNLYPFEETIADTDCTLDRAIENIDIGGPAMIRAAAKNYRAVAVATSEQDYGQILTAIKSGGIDDELRFKLAIKAFAHTAAYDAAIAEYLHERGTTSDTDRFPERMSPPLRKHQDLRYGENPHQKAAFYLHGRTHEASVAHATRIQGKEMSYNNLADADTALECVRQFYEPACVIVKHANPCGAAVDGDCLAAYERAHSADATSAYGGIIAINRSLDGSTAAAMVRQFAEVIVAPEVQDDAREVFSQKPGLRILVTGWWDMERLSAVQFASINGGVLVQERDIGLVNPSDLNVVSARSPGEHEMRDLLFAWKICKFVKSNAIVFAKDQMTIGIGAGQTSRVQSTRLAAIKAADAGLAVKGSVLASDAFFPFRDSIDTAAEHDVIAVIQPGGSKRDAEIIAAVDEHNMAMVLTGMRHFRH